eukprot:TRINITY_DN7204_c0_g1_i1.p1 TRINITY_DN7204_c0_g1~~TRINITY_DN7204_c0_g1_i1.p1  ORF type:complete len:257 (+),score=67.47 TRINITY_DN7204_c0_g1_i1:33-773(+)
MLDENINNDLIFERLKNDLYSIADPQQAEFAANYLKKKIPCLGVKAPKIDSLMRDYFKTDLKALNVEELKNIGISFLKCDSFEEKRVAICIFKKISNKLDLPFIIEIESLFPEYVFEWATCDGLSSRVINNIIRNKGLKIVDYISQWKDSTNIWLQRSSCVSLVKDAHKGIYTQQIIDICSTTIQNEERFVQLGTGWVLRNLSQCELLLVVNFIKENFVSFSREGLRYAIEKMDPELKSELMKFSP